MRPKSFIVRLRLCSALLAAAVSACLNPWPDDYPSERGGNDFAPPGGGGSGSPSGSAGAAPMYPAGGGGGAANGAGGGAGSGSYEPPGQSADAGVPMVDAGLADGGDVEAATQ